MSVRKWLYFTFINLLIVAFLGLILRYKITFSLPFLDQKFLQHGHSHFALTGWITQILMVLMASKVSDYIDKDHFKRYQWILIANMIAAFGMLISFPFQGYGTISIAFSSLSILVSYVFAYKLWKDIDTIKKVQPSFKWYKAALVFSILSAIGVFLMVYLMITRSMNPNHHLAAIYLFLHFQYNGWFVFSCFGLLTSRFKNKLNRTKLNLFFWMNAMACFPAYFLSVPWLPIPKLFFVIVVLSAVVQFISWIWIAFISKNLAVYIFSTIPVLAKWLVGLSALAYTLKVALQLGSAIPTLSSIAFGFRPIVVAYLHLVFLGVVSLFILGYVFGWIFIRINKLTKAGIVIFIVGVVLMEVALMVQGVFAINYYIVPYINEIIFGMTAVLFIGLVIFNIGILRQKNKNSIVGFQMKHTGSQEE